MKFHKLTYIILWVGGINWGLIGLFGFNLVDVLFGSLPTLASLVYVLIGLSAVYTISTHMSYCKFCSTELKKSKKK